MPKTIGEINERIKRGEAVILTAEEMVELVKSKGPEAAAKEVDVVTTGTFGAMCSSGAFLNLGHSDPPIKLGGGEAYLNDVPAYTGLAAVDVYIGATALSRSKGLEYGGGHVIEDLVRGREIELVGKAYGTDCYPRTEIKTTFTIHDLNQAILCNPRNCYQTYVAATNSTDQTLYTYMGILLPNFGNVTFAGAGCLNPLTRDPTYRTIGTGTHIFLGGGEGYVVGEGTQHSPTNQRGTIMVAGDLKQMNPKFLRGGTITRYGCTLFVGIGIPIPILDEKMAIDAGKGNEEIFIDLVDYGVPRRERPVLRRVSYAELFSGKVTLDGREIPVSPLSSVRLAREIANTLKRWIEKGEFLLTEPVRRLPTDTSIRPMKQIEPVLRVREIMTRKLVTVGPDETLETAARLIKQHGIDHLPVVEKGRLVGIVTSWDLAVSIGTGKKKIAEIMTREVITARDEEPIEVVIRRLEQHKISGVPVIDEKGTLVGMVTTDDISKAFGRKR
jgi:uncharacterized protein (DUF39 family)/predicted transcriptional regulator